MQDDREIQRQLSSRTKEVLANFKTSPSKADMLIHTVHTDIGVARNGGRRGARFGAQAVLASFKKLTRPQDRNLLWSERIVSSASLDDLNFSEAQQRESENITFDLEKTHVHLGGGHDHIYPLLMSLQSFKKPIHVINIDAHLDTRIDNYFHSGTPFRQFANMKTVPFRLTQIGIRPFSNAKSNYTSLRGTKMTILDVKTLETLSLSQEELTVLSLDCDALDGSFFSSVSAVNPMGLTKMQFFSIWNFYLKSIVHRPIIGIYEYNPVYDDISGQGAKFLAAFLYHIGLKKVLPQTFE